ncbi:MAG: signal peptidase I [Limisphaerales bacterium]
MDSTPALSLASQPAVGGAPDPLPSGGFRQCLRHPAMLASWILSRRYRHALEMRKHVWKIRCFQMDELDPKALAAIDEGIRAFDAVLRSRPSAPDLEAGARDFETCANRWLRPYANASMRENVEVFLVAIGVAMAIRTFFLQPFKIPTGSMQPTLYGVHFEDLRLKPDAVVPGTLERIAAALVRGEYYHEIVAEDDGRVLRVEPRKSMAFISYQDVILEYRGAGGIRQKKERVWFSPVDGHGGDLRGFVGGMVGQTGMYYPIAPGHVFRKGDYILRLRDSAGDHLFVDRVSYNFRPPKRGEIVVFETRGIRDLTQDQFYIKRLVGLGGEVLRLGDDRHLRIDGNRLDKTTPHFSKVYGFDGPPAESQYSGHVNGTVAASLNRGANIAPLFRTERMEYQIPPGRYMVMGDNTLNSLDSRAWGDFPETNIVGKYCFVWWPFTERWGTRPE